MPPDRNPATDQMIKATDQMINVGRAVTPTTDTNALGRCQSALDTWNALSQASDSVGHIDQALQASGRRGASASE